MSFNQRSKTLLLCLAIAISTPFTFAQQSVAVADVSAAASVRADGDAQRTIVPRLVKYSGVVRDANGDPRTGIVGINFSIYSTQQGGSSLWMETQNVQLDSQGRFNVLLGAGRKEGLPADIFVSNDAHWLGVQVLADAEAEQPRVFLVSVPYAIKAQDADTLGGRPASEYLLNDSLKAMLADAQVSNRIAGSRAAFAPEVNGAVSTSTPGTSGTLPKFGAVADSLVDSIITEKLVGAEMRVGIGTGVVDPAAKLEINGRLKAEGFDVTSSAHDSVHIVNTAADGLAMQLTSSGPGFAIGLLAGASSTNGIGLAGVAKPVLVAQVPGDFSYGLIGFNFNRQGAGLFGVSTYTGGAASGVPPPIGADIPVGVYGSVAHSSGIAGIFDDRATTGGQIFSGRVNGTEIVSINRAGDIVTAGTITSAGAPVATTTYVDAGDATESAARTAAIATEATARAAGDAAALASSNTYTDSQISAEATARAAGDAATLASSNTYTDSQVSAEATARAAAIAAEATARAAAIAAEATARAAGSAASSQLAGTNVFTGSNDFSGATATSPVRALTGSLPGTCSANVEMVLKTDAAIGQQLYSCNATSDGWNLVSGSATTLTTANTYTDTQIATESSARAAGDAATLASANTYADAQVATETAARTAAVAAEATARAAGDAATLASANTYADTQVATEAAARVSGDAASLASANTYTDAETAARTAAVTAEATARVAGDAASLAAVTSEAATRAADDATETAARIAADLLDAKLAGGNIFTGGKQTLAISTATTASLNIDGGATLTTPASGDIWNENGLLLFNDGTTTHTMAFTDSSVTTATNSLSLGGVAASSYSTKTYADAGDATTLNSANTYADTQVATEATARTAGDAATLASANTYADTQVASEAAARTAAITAEATARTAGDAATLASANTYADTQVASEAAARTAAVAAEASARSAGDAATLTSANSYSDTTVATEATARAAGDAATLASANTYTDASLLSEVGARLAGDSATLASANAYTDTETAARTAADLLKANLAGGNVFTGGTQTLAAGTTAAASLNIPNAVAPPTAPVIGDIWNESGSLKVRFDGTTTKTLAYTDGGASMTNLDASNVTSGTLSDGLLSANVALLSGTQTFTGVKTFSSTIVGNISGNSGTATALAADPADCAANQFANAINASGTLTCAGLSLSGSQFANQGTTTTVLHGNATGNPSFGSIVNADIAAGTIDLAAKVTGILPGANGGTSNGFFAVTGPSTALKTFTFPDASASILTTNALVTVAQGGTGNATGNAVTATALATNGANCAGGISVAVGVDASGAGECATIQSGSTTQLGVAQASTAVQVSTGTDAALYISPNSLAHSDHGKREMQFVVFDFTTAHSSGNGKFYFVVPASITGMNLIAASAQSVAVGTTGSLTIQLSRCSAVVGAGAACSATVTSMLGTLMTIDSGENSSVDATAPTIVAASVTTGQIIRVDVPTIHTAPGQGLILNLTFQLP